MRTFVRFSKYRLTNRIFVLYNMQCKLAQFIFMENTTKYFLGWPFKHKILCQYKRGEHMAYRNPHTTSAPKADDYVQSLIREREKSLSQVVKEASAYLLKIEYYSLENDKRIEFLCSSDGLAIVENLSKKRVTFSEIASTLGYSQKELHEIIKNNDGVYDAIDRGRSSELDEAEKMIYKLATGYYINEESTRTVDNGRGREPIVEKQDKQRYIMPNFYAQKYLMEQKRQMEYKAEQERAEFEKNKINLEIVVIGEDELVKE